MHATGWKLAHGRVLALHPTPILAILNLTPDSFYAASRFDADIVDHAARFVADGAAMLDLGPESTRPGAAPVPADVQLQRLLPAVEAIRRAPAPLGTIPLSIDTTSAAVADAALSAGANAINDVSAGLDDPAMLATVAKHSAGIILMHRLAPPSADAYSDKYASPPAYDDVVTHVRDFLQARARQALAAGIPPEAIVLDPGLGFGKTVAQNLDLIARTAELAALGHPILSALSRKSFIGRVALNRDSDPAERLAGTLAASVLHLRNGASLARVHDVREHRQALDTLAALGGPARPPDAPPAPGR